MDYLTTIKATISRLHRCEAKHVGSTPIAEICEGRLVWTEEVETFELTGHPAARRCYAWRCPKGRGDWDVVTVLEISPVVSARTAVRAVMLAESNAAVRGSVPGLRPALA